MPVYAYRCDNCGIQFDKKQHFSDPPLKLCPKCGKKALHKVYTPVGIVFKGSGFYATDHRSPSGQNNSKPAHEEKAATPTTSGNSSESSTATSSETTPAKTNTETSTKTD